MSSLRKPIFLIIFLVTTMLVSEKICAELVDEAEEEKSMAPKSKSPLIQQTDELKTKPQQSPQAPIQRPVVEPRPTTRPKGKTVKVGVVKFWSKSLSGFGEKDTLILEEDVVVTQDDIRLEADKATIYFEQGGKDVKEVHAVGAVKFSRVDPETGQPIRAEGKEAIFNNAKRNVVMKGDPVLKRGDDVVRGKVIHYDLTNGWVKADRVEGVVQPATKKAGLK